jgi:NADH dehydrogenase FAD-containing subunit
MDGVFALGDCVDVGGQNHPATAQVAEQQGVYLANAWVAAPAGRVPLFL